MSSGDKFDDFPHTDYLVNFIQKYNTEEYKALEIDLVFNGDTFDFLKMQVDGKFPHIIDEDIALKKLAIIEQAHKKFFDALEEFVDAIAAPRRVHFIVGNHDYELLFPKVQQRIVQLCGGSGQIHFPGYGLTLGDLHIEHGNQQDSLFSMPVGEPFINHGKKEILNHSWASVSLINVMLPMREDFHELDRIKPRHAPFDEIPHFKEFLLGKLWKFWRSEYLNFSFRSDDPLKKVSWSMISEAFKRSLFFNADVAVGGHFKRRIMKDNKIKTFVIGHIHDPKIKSFGDRKFIQSGCFRDEFMVKNSKEYSLIAKSYVEVLMKNNQVITSNLVEIEPPEIDATRYPKPLKDFIPAVQRRLGNAEERLKAKLDIEAQEKKEGFDRGH